MSMLDAVKRFCTGRPVFQSPAVSVEIGSEWIKVAQAGSGFGEGRISRLVCQPVKGDDGAESALRQILAETGVRTRNMTLVLPRNQVAVRMLRVPATQPEEISKIVHLQAGRLTPYSSDEVVSSYDVLKTDKDGYSTVLLAIARRRLISEKMALIATCGGTVDTVVAGSEGVFRQIDRLTEDDFGEDIPVAVLNVDSGYSELIIFYCGSPVFTKNVLIGSKALKENATRWQGELINEMVTGVDEFKKDYPSAPDVAKLIFSGMETPSSLATALNDVCGISIQPMDLNGPLSVSPGGDNDVSTVAVVGWALSGDRQGVDLLPPEDQIAKVMSRRRNQLNIAGVLGLFIVTLMLALLMIGYYERSMKVDSLNEQIGAIKPVADLVGQRQQQVFTLASRLDAAGTPLELLAELQRITPDNIHLTSLKINAKNDVSLRGQAVTMSDIFDYGNILEKSRMLKSVDSNYSSGQDNRTAEFTITCRFQKPAHTTKRDER